MDQSQYTMGYYIYSTSCTLEYIYTMKSYDNIHDHAPYKPLTHRLSRKSQAPGPHLALSNKINFQSNQSMSKAPVVTRATLPSYPIELPFHADDHTPRECCRHVAWLCFVTFRHVSLAAFLHLQLTAKPFQRAHEAGPGNGRQRGLCSVITSHLL